jgi:histidinol-phosphatase (PHP family)
MIVDYHVHLRNADNAIDHTVAAVEPFVEVAAARGIDEIGLVEHVYYFRQTRNLWWDPYQIARCVYDLDAYVEAVVEAKRRGLPVKLALEVDWVGERQAELTEILAPYPWDYLLGSVHWVDGRAVDQQSDRGIWANETVDGAWRRYFDALARFATGNHVDVLAHPDLAKIFGLRPTDPVSYYPPLDGVVLEVSTGGLRKPVAELYPDPVLLAGHQITLASDAHMPHPVGEDFDQALSLVRESGHDTATVFDGRTPGTDSRHVDGWSRPRMRRSGVDRLDEQAALDQCAGELAGAAADLDDAKPG